jgi:hypothetical protein
MQAHAANSFVREHLQALHIGSEVTRWFRKERQPQVLNVSPENVIDVLHRAGINPVLMGAHGINGYRDEARASQDVDVLVTKREVRKAIRALAQAFPSLKVHENSAVARFVDPVSQTVVLEVMKPSSQPIQLVLRNTVAVGDRYRIPTLEMALVSKYVAIRSPDRIPRKRHLDRADFTSMVEENRAILDLDKLQKLAARVQPGGGNHILSLIADIDAGREIQR